MVKVQGTNQSEWIPDRQDVVWINCNPQAGNEMRDIHPFLVLSPRNFNKATSLIIGLPMTTAEYNDDNLFAVAVGNERGKKSEKTSYVLCHQPKSFDWKNRKCSPHPMKRLSDDYFVECCARLNQIIQLSM
ncbi:MAG: type II toxin-antitoxin system PemK/MazF family toxin [Desulfuromonadales bacterium]|nr:type II toxin-antitoxin system PemK/MazF family toxin [Desulfuromonadales bacterium]